MHGLTSGLCKVITARCGGLTHGNLVLIVGQSGRFQIHGHFAAKRLNKLTKNEINPPARALVTNRLSKFLMRILWPAQEAPEKRPQAATCQQAFVKLALIA